MSAGSGFSRDEADKTRCLAALRARLAQATPQTPPRKRLARGLDGRRSAAALALLGLFLLGMFASLGF